MTPSTIPNPLPDQLRAAVGGDSTALERLARAWWPQVRRWSLYELGDPVRAEDAAQDTLLRLVRFIGGYDLSRPFAPWLRTLTRNACRDLHQREKPSAPSLQEVPTAPDPDRALDLAQGHARALEAFARLTSRQREVFDLCDRQGLNATQVANLLEITPGTVRATLRDARVALRRDLLARHPELADLVRP